jgi:hypothetical protein
LPLAGGTLTGALSGTSATFSSTLTASKGTFNGSTSEPVTFERIISGTSIRRYSLAISGAGSFSLYDATADADRLIISSTGAATFSSTITAGNNITTSNSFISNVINGYGLILRRDAVTNYNGISLQTASSAQWFIGMRENLSSNNFIIYNENGTDALTISKSNSDATFIGEIFAQQNIRAFNAIQFRYNNTFRGQILPYNAYGGGSDFSPFFTSESTLAFGVNGNATKALMIASGGNVLINTTSDNGNRFQVFGNSSFTTNSDSVVDIFTLRNNSATSSGLRQRFQNGFGDLAAIRVSQRDNGALADDGQMEFQVASNSVLDTKFTLRNDGAIFLNSFTYNNTVSGGTRNVFIDNSNALGGISSIRASKKNIQEFNSQWIYDLQPVQFNYRKKDEDGNYTEDVFDELTYGLIAEDTALIADFLINYNDNKDGTKEMVGIEYMRLITPMLKAIQELKAEIDELKNK